MIMGLESRGDDEVMGDDVVVVVFILMVQDGSSIEEK